ncbi:MAG: ABC transporter ATP-binding protein [Bacilli bacterium]|nr:ABC transporter ATP-binding protein [Mollicutes bacterium]MDY6071700.1 ABC transporter ATP-binding protein [Bacilli bacterium]
MKIELKNVTKEFDKVEIIKNISLEFETGKIYGLYGRNGSGKSVLMKLICGFLIPTKGKVLINGKDFNAKNEYPDNLRAVIEKPSFFPELTGFENLKLLAKIQNKINDEEIIKALDLVNLIDEKDKKYSKYSLGMKQKLAIAQAIMEDPSILILDEPFNGIEEKSVEKITKFLKEEAKNGKTIIFSTHIKEDLENLADIIYKIDNGTIYENQG